MRNELGGVAGGVIMIHGPAHTFFWLIGPLPSASTTGTKGCAIASDDEGNGRLWRPSCPERRSEDQAMDVQIMTKLHSPELWAFAVPRQTRPKDQN